MNKTNSTHVVLLVILIIFAIIMLVYTIKKGSDTKNYNNTTQENPKTVVTPPPVVVDKSTKVLADPAKKADILKKASTKGVLSVKDRAEISAAISGSKINEYGFTPAEVKMVIEALNRK